MTPPSASGEEEYVDQDQQVQLAREIATRLTTWFQAEGRRFPWREEHLDGWKVLVTEMLLQQTQAARVATFLGEFFHQYPTLESIASEDEERLAAVLAPLGLQNRRAHCMRQLAIALLDNGGEIPRTRTSLLRLPGVGPYVANAYLSATRGGSLS